MKLPVKLPFLKKDSKKEYYLALVLRDEKTEALIFAEQAGKITIVAKHEEALTEVLDETPLDDLVSVLDKTISRVEEKLPTDVELKNTVFGVKDSWVEEKKIKKEYLSKLKHICGELDLSPIGFIVISEAIVHLIKQEEGAPVTALVTEVGKDVVTVSLFRAGKLIETKKKPISDTAMLAVDDALKEFEHVEILPSRIILFHSIVQNDAREKDALTQKFIAHSWSKSLPFLQIPQVSILPHGFDGKAIVAGAATQLGFTLTDLPQDTTHTDIQTIENKHTLKEVKKEKKSKDEEEFEQEMKEEDVSRKDEVPEEENEAENFGFVMDKEITALPAEDKPTIGKKRVETATDKTEEDDISENPPEDEAMPNHKKAEPEQEEEEPPVLPPKKQKKSHFSFMSLILKPLRKIATPKLPTNKGLLFIPPVLVLLLIGLLALYFFQVKAEVRIIVSPKSINETERITLSTKSDNDFTQNIVAAKEINVPLDGSVTTETTGEKEVGEKAKGTVTIYNSDEAKKTFKEGTTITSEKGLKYSMDKEVNVASASGDIFTGIKSGTAQVAVTAEKIGTEYNLPSNAKFSIEGTNTVAAKNESAFSGGSKRKVSVVSEKDVDKLKEELPKSLEGKAREELQKKISSDEELLSSFTQVDLTKESLDNDIDKEAKTVKLTGTVRFTSIAYNRNDLLSFAENSIRKRYSEDELSKNNIDTKLSGLKDTSESELTGVAAINAGLLPKIDTEAVKKELVGKSFTEANEYAKRVSSQVQNVEIVLQPNLPFLPQVLPRRIENIIVTVQSS